MREIAVAALAAFTMAGNAQERPQQAHPVPPIVFVMAKVQWKWNTADGFISPFWNSVKAEQQGFATMLTNGEQEHARMPEAIKTYLRRVPMDKVSQESKELKARPVCRDAAHCTICSQQLRERADAWRASVQQKVDAMNGRSEGLAAQSGALRESSSDWRDLAVKNKVTITVSNTIAERPEPGRTQVVSATRSTRIPDPDMIAKADDESSRAKALIDEANSVQADGMDIYKQIKVYWVWYYDRKYAPAGYGQLPSGVSPDATKVPATP